MEHVPDKTDQALLDDWQRDFPIEPRPFDRIAERLGIPVQEVLTRLQRYRDTGRMTRVGATCAPNTVSASTLAAIAAPEDRIEEVAAIIGAEPGVNHSYLRENDWNLWFVATGPDRAHVDATLDRISGASGLEVLDLRLVRPFNVDLGFSMRGKSDVPLRAHSPDRAAFEETDRPILQALTKGLPICATPYASIAAELGRDEAQILSRIRALCTARIIARLGVIVRHRALGWRANAMVVWDMPSAAITRAGPILAAHPGVTLCYERVSVPGKWPYRLYSMIHSRSRAEALGVLDQICARPEFHDVPHLPLFSLQCFKQNGALVARQMEATA